MNELGNIRIADDVVKTIAAKAHEIQKSVLKAVSELSGLKVVEVNVYVQDVKIRTEGTSEEEEDTEEGL